MITTTLAERTRATSSWAEEPRRRSHPVLRLATVVAALATASLLIGRALLPDGTPAALEVDTALPWFGAGVPVLALLSAMARSRAAAAATLTLALAWGAQFVPAMLPLSTGAAGGAPLTVASQNVMAGSATAAESARRLAGTGAGLVAVEEMDSAQRGEVDAVLGGDYPHRVLLGTVGLWSRYPISSSAPLTLGLGWTRALNAVVETPTGPVSVYVVHAASVRPGDEATRDTMLRELSELVGVDAHRRVLALGDFNAASTDRMLAPLRAELTEAAQSDGGLGFTWPAGLPLVRLDHVFSRGFEATVSRTFDAGASDHLAVTATLRAG